MAEAENLPDRDTRSRVHAWYRTHGIASDTSAPVQPVAGGTHAVSHPDASSPDLATTARRATTADFDRAAAAQRLTIQSAQEQNSRQTTAADDAADAETHIPSTAPTEREPAPFVHGEAPQASLPAGGIGSRPASPIVRQRSGTPGAAVTTAPGARPATPQGTGATSAAPPSATPLAATPTSLTPLSAVPSSVTGRARTTSESTVDLGAPAALTPQTAPALAHIDLHAPRSQVRTGRVAANASVKDAAVLAANPVGIAAGDTSSRTIRAIAAETAATPTPHLQLPAPPVSSRRPAIAAIQAGAAHPMLDAAVTAGMADETFDGDPAPATAGTAIRLATAGAPPRARTGAPGPDETGPALAAVNVNLFDGRGHLLLLPSMKGTHEILVHQNQMALSDGLERIQNDGQLADMRRAGLLIALPDDDSIYPNDALPLNRRFARPWTVRFLQDLARAHDARFGTPLIVTSAARTVDFQRHLVRINGNAAPPSGDIASPHLYGQAIDLAKRGMSLTEIMWLRAYLTPVEDEGKIDVEEEFQQACFHISVYRRYLGALPPRRLAAAPPAQLQGTVAPTPAPEKRHRLPIALLATHLP